MSFKGKSVLKLPRPQRRGRMSVEEALGLRRTTRKFSNRDVGLSVVSQLLWALQGITYVEHLPESKKVFHKAAPSAGKTFPLEVYAAFSEGLFRYEPRKHLLRLVSEKDVREKLSEAAFTQLNKEAIKTAPLTIILTADNNKALKSTPLLENVVRFVHLEAGHAAQNLVLQATSLGLGVCTVTSYNNAIAYEALKLPLNHRPIYLLPIGFPEETKQ